MPGIEFTTRLTDVGIDKIADALASNTPFNIDAWKLGSDANIVLDGSNTDVVGTVVDSGTSSELQYDIVASDQTIIRVILDESKGPYDFGNVGLFSGTDLIAIGTFSQQVPKTPNAVGVTGDRIEISTILTFTNVGEAINVNNISPNFASPPFVQRIVDLPDPNIAPYELYIVREEPTQNRPITAIRNEDPPNSGDFIWTFDYHNQIAGDATNDNNNRFEIDINNGNQKSFIAGTQRLTLSSNSDETTLSISSGDNLNKSITIKAGPAELGIQSNNLLPLVLNQDGNDVVANVAGSTFNIGEFSTTPFNKFKVSSNVTSNNMIALFKNTVQDSELFIGSPAVPNGFLSGTSSGDIVLGASNDIFIGTTNDSNVNFVINNDSQLTITDTQILINEGTSSFATPHIARNTDTDTGLVWSNANDVSLVAGGIQIARASNNGGDAFQLLVNSDAGTSNPSISFTSSTDTGINLLSPGNLSFITEGLERLRITNSSLELQNNTAFAFGDGTEANPSITFTSEPDTGFYKGSNSIKISIDSQEAIEFKQDLSNVPQIIFNNPGVASNVNISLGVGTTGISGLYFPSQSVTAISANGFEKFRIDTSGVRIGESTSTPITNTAIKEIDNIQQMYAGKVFNTNTATASKLPNGWSAFSISGPGYVVQHNLGKSLDDLAVIVTANVPGGRDNGLMVEPYNPNLNNAFQVVAVDHANAGEGDLEVTDFAFMVTVLP